jgi:GT2 family glycosyltransferase
MISIITAIHNQLAINKLFYENLVKYTYHPFELIIIDNNSTDGSKEFFKGVGAKVIENKQNFSYPYCQNQGIKSSCYDYLAFLNNDIIVAPQWDKRLIEIAQKHNLEVFTPSGIEKTETPQSTKKMWKKWNIIKNVVSRFGKNRTTFNIMTSLMYGNWENFSQARFQKFNTQIIEGFVGNSIIMNRSAIDKIGLWDERLQAADFDLYIRTKKRNLEHGDILPVHTILGVFHHHFIRITAKSKPTKFADEHKLITLNQKWGNDKDKYLKDIFV